MEPFSFVHAADLHLDSPFKGISEIDQDKSQRLSEATFEAYNNIIDTCIENQVDFLLIAGDIYNGADKSLRAQLKFRDGLKRLDKEGIQAYIVSGNHDPLSGWSANLHWPENTNFFGKSLKKIIHGKDDEPIAQIYGISHHKRNITSNLSDKFLVKSDYDPFTIGILHCNIGTHTGHEPYAPCSIEDLIEKNYNYWAIGHIHKKNILNKNRPLILYSGNPQGLNPNETGAKGCYLINVDEKGDTTQEFIECDCIRWFIEDLNIESIDSEEDLITVIENQIETIREKANERPAICRIKLTGRGPIHSIITRKGFLDDLIKDLRELGESESQFVWLESLTDETRPEFDRESLAKGKDFIGDLVRLFDEFYEDETKISELNEILEPLFASPGGRKLLEVFEDDQLLELLRKAETFCLDKLLEGEEN